MEAWMQGSVMLSEDETKVVLLDQTRLPNEEVYLTLGGAEELYEAIAQLRVRGAPAIGICAGYALYCLSLTIKTEDLTEFKEKIGEYSAYLASSRPTAVNLSWALNRLMKVVNEYECGTVAQLQERLKEETKAIHREDVAMCRAISELGLSLLGDGDGILTHCNAGPLATSQYGTALGPILLGHEQGKSFHVFADETRPLLQGARITAYELDKAGVDVTLICDNMASMVMKNGWVQACLVGCDRVAANGDTVNKIGTSGVAILAKHYGVPFYVLGPTSTIDLNCTTGADIPIEERKPEEIKEKWYTQPMAPTGVKCFNPAFDVTDHSLITAIITEKGIVRPPFREGLSALFEK